MAVLKRTEGLWQQLGFWLELAGATGVTDRRRWTRGLQNAGRQGTEIAPIFRTQKLHNM